jgi:hypothetical protein
MKKIMYGSLLIVYCLLLIPSVHAEYVLPSPSYMPGNKIYKLTRIFDALKRYWFFGNIAQFKYHLGLSDKYLVEAKTLMEYKQYLLASDALVRSDKEFGKVAKYLHDAKQEGVDISQLKSTLSEAIRVHIDMLTKLKPVVPSQFTWTPEKDKPTELKLLDMLVTSIELRRNIANDIQTF